MIMLSKLVRMNRITRHFSLVTCNVMTIEEVRIHLADLLGAEKTFRGTKTHHERPDLSSYLAKSREELSPKNMKHSFKKANIPLSDASFREKYINAYNSIRFGKLLENLDTFAVLISYAHNSDMLVHGKSPLSIVTAMVDEINLLNPIIDPTVDILMEGHVSWVGTSSLEIYMWLTQNSNIMLNAKFVMVARDPKSSRAAFVNPLLVETDEAKTLFQCGEKSKQKRLSELNDSLLKLPPSIEERETVHKLFLSTLDMKTMSFRSRKLPEGSIWMEDTKLKNCVVCFPEKRNIHNKIFGGYLMRKGFELAWANACVFSKSRPFLKAVDDIMFRCPVPLGSLLLMSSQVCYTQEKSYHIRVHAEVMDPKLGTSITSNTFNFTFACEKAIPEVLPRTYGEAMLYLHGRRHFAENRQT